MSTEFPTNAAPNAPAIAASLLYGILLQPLQSAFGEFGSLITSELATLPLRDSHDALGMQLQQRFVEEDVHHD